MTTAVIAIAAFAIVGTALGIVIWLARTALSDRARTADTLFDLATANAEVERAGFELATTKQALQAATDRAAALERSLFDAMSESDPGAGLADDDVRGRVLRIVDAYRAARAAGEVPAEPAGPVLDPSTTDVADPG